jgi:hypothetical protein
MWTRLPSDAARVSGCYDSARRKRRASHNSLSPNPTFPSPSINTVCDISIKDNPVLSKRHMTLYFAADGAISITGARFSLCKTRNCKPNQSPGSHPALGASPSASAVFFRYIDKRHHCRREGANKRTGGDLPRQNFAS